MSIYKGRGQNVKTNLCWSYYFIKYRLFTTKMTQQIVQVDVKYSTRFYNILWHDNIKHPGDSISSCRLKYLIKFGAAPYNDSRWCLNLIPAFQYSMKSFNQNLSTKKTKLHNSSKRCVEKKLGQGNHLIYQVLYRGRATTPLCLHLHAD